VFERVLPGNPLPCFHHDGRSPLIDGAQGEHELVLKRPITKGSRMNVVVTRRPPMIMSLPDMAPVSLKEVGS